jgi:hypothetical protein
MQLHSTGYLEEIRRVVRTHHWIVKTFPGDGIQPLLLSHAGFSAGLNPSGFPGNVQSTGQVDYAAFDAWVAAGATDLNSWFYAAGFARGGSARVGGPLWCDALAFQPTRGVRQIFGHTPQTAPKRYKKLKNCGGEALCINVQDGIFVGVLVDEAGKIVGYKKRK